MCPFTSPTCLPPHMEFLHCFLPPHVMRFHLFREQRLYSRRQRVPGQQVIPQHYGHMCFYSSCFHTFISCVSRRRCQQEDKSLTWLIRLPKYCTSCWQKYMKFTYCNSKNRRYVPKGLRDTQVLCRALIFSWFGGSKTLSGPGYKLRNPSYAMSERNIKTVCWPSLNDQSYPIYLCDRNHRNTCLEPKNQDIADLKSILLIPPSKASTFSSLED